jgi:hypothetical protein
MRDLFVKSVWEALTPTPMGHLSVNIVVQVNITCVMSTGVKHVLQANSLQAVIIRFALHVLKDRFNLTRLQPRVELVVKGNITTSQGVVLGLTVKLVDMAESAKLDLLYAPHVQQVQAL